MQKKKTVKYLGKEYVINFMEDNGHRPKRKRKLLVREIAIDHSYQRTIRISRLKEIGEEYRESLLAPIHVSVRKGGELVCFDGHHRLIFTRDWLKEGKIDAFCWEGLTVEEEARYFDVWNSGRSQNTPLESFKARIVAKDADALAIKKILNSFGVEVALSTSESGTHLKCIATVEQVYKHDKEEGLKAILGLIQAAWSGEYRHRLKRAVIGGLYAFLGKFGDEFDQARLITKMKTKDPRDLITRAQYKKEEEGYAIGEAFGRVLVTIYNSQLGRASDKRLYWDS